MLGPAAFGRRHWRARRVAALARGRSGSAGPRCRTCPRRSRRAIQSGPCHGFARSAIIDVTSSPGLALVTRPTHRWVRKSVNATSWRAPGSTLAPWGKAISPLREAAVRSGGVVRSGSWSSSCTRRKGTRRRHLRPRTSRSSRTALRLPLPVAARAPRSMASHPRLARRPTARWMNVRAADSGCDRCRSTSRSRNRSTANHVGRRNFEDAGGDGSRRDQPPELIGGQSAGHQSPCGSVVWPTSMMYPSGSRM